MDTYISLYPLDRGGSRVGLDWTLRLVSLGELKICAFHIVVQWLTRPCRLLRGYHHYGRIYLRCETPPL
jgi:hypothetical protein